VPVEEPSTASKADIGRQVFRIIAGLVPRDLSGPLQDDFDHLTDRELIEQLSKEARRLLRQDEMGDVNAGS
jgi:hypothetical protein